MTLKIVQQTFELLPQGAVYWQEQKALLLADVHLGKVSHFRKNGYAIPAQIQFSFYQKMEQLLTAHNVEKIFFLGDLFHSDRNAEWDRFVAWNQSLSQQTILVKGNHDILPMKVLEQSGLFVVTEWMEKNILLTHHPTDRSGLFNFSGHIHPGVRLQGAGRQRLKVPCFFHQPNQMILPAFGDFTGLHLLQPKAGDRVYALTGEAVVEIKIVA